MVRKTRKDAWTQEESQTLDKLYSHADQGAIQQLLPNRTWKAIRRRAKQQNQFRGNYIPPLERLPNYHPDIYTRIWLACAIDCDGTINLVSRRSCKNFQPNISFCNTNYDIVDHFRKLTFPDRKISVTVRPPNKTKYDFPIANMPLVYQVLSCIEPYLIAKKQQAIHLMNYIEIENERMKHRKKYGAGPTPEQRILYDTMRELNRRGI